MEIKQLIDRYMNGQTTVDEEQILARYFRSATDLPDDLQPYRDMFAYFDEGMPVGEVSEFDGSAEQTDAAVDSGNCVVAAPRRRYMEWGSGCSSCRSSAVGGASSFGSNTAAHVGSNTEGHNSRGDRRRG